MKPGKLFVLFLISISSLTIFATSKKRKITKRTAHTFTQHADSALIRQYLGITEQQLDKVVAQRLCCSMCSAMFETKLWLQDHIPNLPPEVSVRKLTYLEAVQQKFFNHTLQPRLKHNMDFMRFFDQDVFPQDPDFFSDNTTHAQSLTSVQNLYPAITLASFMKISKIQKPFRHTRQIPTKALDLYWQQKKKSDRQNYFLQKLIAYVNS
jgi:hypothetical protein